MKNLQDIVYVSDGMELKDMTDAKIPTGEYRIIEMQWKDGNVQYAITNGTRKFTVLAAEIETRSPSIETKVRRDKGETFMEFNIPKVVEEMFKAGSEIKTSAKWPGLKFYYQAKIQGHPSYEKMLSENKLRDNFGAPLFADGKINVAFLRTVGGKGCIPVEPSIPMAEWSDKLGQLTAFIKQLMQEYYLKSEVSASITILQ